MAKRILLVDDDLSDIKAMKNPLKKQGYSVLVATTTKAALSAAEKKDFDLILINIMMPDVSGYELAMLLTDIVPSKTKVAFVSILPEREAEKTHVDGYIQKPFSPETVIRNVKKILTINRKKRGGTR